MYPKTYILKPNPLSLSTVEQLFTFRFEGDVASAYSEQPILSRGMGEGWDERTIVSLGGELYKVSMFVGDYV